MNAVETERLLLRPFEEDDLDFLDQLHGDEEVMRFILGHTRTHAENKAYLANLLDWQKKYGLGQRIVLRKSDGVAVGRCGYSLWTGMERQGMEYYDFDPKSLTDGEKTFQITELGYSFSRNVWGKGYATEAASAMRDTGLRDLKLEKIISLIDQKNTASMAVAERIGLTRGDACMCHNALAWKYSL